MPSTGRTSGPKTSISGAFAPSRQAAKAKRERRLSPICARSPPAKLCVMLSNCRRAYFDHERQVNRHAVLTQLYSMPILLSLRRTAMYSQQELDDAVASGVITIDAANALRAHVELQRATAIPDEEQF